MVHTEEVDRRARPVKRGRGPGAAGAPGPLRVRTVSAALVTLVSLLAPAACADTTDVVLESSFGQSGEIHIEVQSLLGDRGRLFESLIWFSEGPWLLTERVSYEGNGGAETLTRSRLNPGELAQEYASLIRQLNRTQGLSLFGGAAPQDPDPQCATPEDLEDPGRPGDPLPDTRVTVTIIDDLRGQEARWVRCAEGTLLGAANTIAPADAAPLGTGEGRVITAAQLALEFAVGDDPQSAYKGTIPFAVIDQGEDSPARPETSRAFVSNTGAPPNGFVDFWDEHRPGAPLPQVDWSTEFVVLVAVGERGEAGDVVRVRRIDGLGPQAGTRIRLVERVPGDFCSPLAREGFPYQVVVVPSARLDLGLPVDFTAPELERIPCDG